MDFEYGIVDGILVANDAMEGMLLLLYPRPFGAQFR